MSNRETSNQNLQIDQPDPPKPPTVEEIPEGMDLINHVAQCLAMGCDPINVRKQLMTFGFKEAFAEKYVADTLDWMRRNPQAGKTDKPTARSRINGNMWMGAFICIFGIAITVVTFLLASKLGAGTYVVAWGAILFGALQFFKGATQAGRELRLEEERIALSQDEPT